MKILITGVHGFVGSNFVDYMRGSGYELYGLDIVQKERAGLLRTYTWEEFDAGVVPVPDAIVHLAGKAHDTKNRSAAEEYFKVNTGLTRKMFDYFLTADCRAFVFFSTAKAAADCVEGVLTEKVEPKPVGPYGESKIEAEEYIREELLRRCASGLALEECTRDVMPEGPDGKRVYIMRPCMIHGPGNKGNLNLLYSVVRRGIPWPLGSFENVRTFTSIGNACFALKGLIEGNAPSGIYNLGDDEPISTNELIEMICSSLGRKARIWHLPKGLMRGVAKVGGWLHLPLDTERLRKLTENYVSSNDKLKGALGIERMPVDAREGFRLTMESFKEQ